MPLRVNWVVPVTHRDYDRMPASVWIRCLQLLPYLEERGVESRVNAPDWSADISVLVRCQNRAAYDQALQLKDRGQRIIFDLAVNYFDQAEVPELGRPVTQRHIAEARRMLSIADAVTTASEFIAERARTYHPLVECLPDSVDSRHFTNIKDERDFGRETIRAVWSGVRQKATELEPILPMLAARGIPLTVISDHPPDLSIPGWFRGRRFDYTFRRWEYTAFPRQLTAGEICVAPRRTDNPYNLGHSLFKVGVFLAAGVPALAGPVPAYSAVLGSDGGGRICIDQAEWEQALDKAVDDRAALLNWSRAGKRRMREYSSARTADRYVRLFERVLDRTGERTPDLEKTPGTPISRLELRQS